MNTQINRQNQSDLASLNQVLCDTGFDDWQIQLTMPQGMAAFDNGALCLSPDDLPLVAKQILAVKSRSPLFIQTADHFGYMDRNEPRLRSGTPGKDQFFTGCQAGMQVVGITSNGAIRGCLSQSNHFNERNIRDDTLETIWQRKGAFSYNRQFHPSQLTGACATCPFKNICRAGCKSLSHATNRTVTENHYCLRQKDQAQACTVTPLKRSISFDVA
ncbi:MAG: SPASM domain-containing protein [Deltaproteobacteria bacterium]|nr:SPASM domain-containing protein [Deltaproteobacteria bacterium]